MSLQDTKELWELVRDNQRKIALLEQQQGAQNEVIRELREDNKKMLEILNRAIGGKTALAVVGSAVVSVITWAITYFSTTRQ